MPTTADTPKCFAEVSGRRLLDWTLSSLGQNPALSLGPENICFVGGYQIEKIQQDYPDFTFRHNDREVWRLLAESGAGATALERRLRALWGKGMRLIEIDCAGELDRRPFDEKDAPAKACRIWGFMGAPGVSRSNRSNQHVFVNCRPIDNVGLGMALREGYHTALMRGKYPVCCLFLEIGPGEVDVNIHPAKREVKFHREREVRRFVAEAVREGLADFHSQRTEAGDQRSEIGEFGLEATDVSAEPMVEQKPLDMGFSQPPSPTHKENVAPLVPQPSTLSPQPPPTTHSSPPLLQVPLRILGVVGKLYVILESDRGLVLMDQHAAHERVLYEQLLEQMERQETASQKLLLPETVELSATDAQFVTVQMKTLNRLGVGLSEFGERTFLLDALPPFVKAADSRKFILELVDKLQAAGEGVNALRLGEDVIIKTVCRHAVKANDSLREEELQNLVDDLRRCEMPYTCPHGRPTIIEMNYFELEKKFGRIQ